jgi:magnesium transporter
MVGLGDGGPGAGAPAAASVQGTAGSAGKKDAVGAAAPGVVSSVTTARADVAPTAGARPDVAPTAGARPDSAPVTTARGDGVLSIEQLSLFLGKNLVITFQERPGDCFQRVRERIRSGKGLIRGAGAGYLCYALLDSVIDAYFPVFEHYGEKLQRMEDSLVESPQSERLSEIHTLRREMVALRRAIWPMREAINFLIREGSEAFTPETRPYLNDCYDHTVQLMDLVESHREMASGLMDVYLSAMSNRMNEVMKVLTIIATIFIPLTFIAGVYGMNFRTEAGPLSMPELLHPYGYVIVMGVMLAISVTMLLFFRRKGWLGRGRKSS